MSGVATRLAVGYVRERAGEQAVAALLARAGERRTVAQLEHERGWSSYAQWLALLEAAVAVLGDGDARRIGASVVSQRVGGASRVVVRALGSVEAVYRHARGAAAKFSTMKTVEPLEVSRQHARIAVPLADGHPPHPLDRDFSAGVLGQVPALFGLAPATLLSAQLEAFQQTVADLVAPGDLGSLLDTLAARGAAAVHAQRVLLVIRLEAGADPVVHADGFPPADAAMYQAKRRSSLAAHRYTAELHVEAAEQLSLETDLHLAVTGGQLRVHYQPQVELASGRLVGAEALVRWAHPARGLVASDAFIPLAERTGPIVEVDRQVLAEACWQRRRWADQGLELTVAVNMSGRTVEDPEAVTAVARVLEATGTPPGAIEVELTESTSMQHDTDLPAILDRRKALGVRLAVDDFGTGYSMLSWLHQLPIDRIKIDRMFVGRLGPGADGAVVAAIVAMAHNLDLEVVAEGVETPAQADQLRAFGCAVGQGYLFGRPVEPDELARQAAGSTNQRSASKSADSPASSSPSPSPSPSPSGVRSASSRRA